MDVFAAYAEAEKRLQPYKDNGTLLKCSIRIGNPEMEQGIHVILSGTPAEASINLAAIEMLLSDLPLKVHWNS